MDSRLVTVIAKAYGLQVSRLLPMQTGYRNKNYPIILENGKIVNIIIFKREENTQLLIRNSNRVANYLAGQGFPARNSFDARILQLTNKQPKQYAAIYNYLPGNTIPWEAYTMDHIKSLGKCMSDMHSVLSGLPKNNLYSITHICEQQLQSMQKYFNNPGIISALLSKLNIQISPAILRKFEESLSYYDHLPNQQPLHMDFVRSNILFSHNSSDISGVLDFEKTAFGSPVFDIARTLAFLLVDCKYKTEDQVMKYFLKSGYIKRGKANHYYYQIKTKIGKILPLGELVNYFLLYDLYKFLKHNPYETLNTNEHFLRTRDILISRGLLAGVAADKLVI